ncbi:hypothetical protein [Gryllotalpicola koreensis]|uniref:Uncharacterized protein n=1 Tax=Gryllotalpicola koreensis TaxID=993086 RepID=A0ABP8A421_9MICO
MGRCACGIRRFDADRARVACARRTVAAMLTMGKLDLAQLQVAYEG